MKQVSVVIPLYNGAKFIAETVNSILGQTYPIHEIAFVDDGSVDNTEQIVRNMAPHAKYIRNDKNSGVCFSRNVGIAQTSGDYVALSDQDDIWLPDKISKQVAAFETYENADFVFTNFYAIHHHERDQKDKFSYAPPNYWTDIVESSHNNVSLLRQPALSQFLVFQPVFPSTVMFRRRMLNATGPFDEGLGREQSEDLEFLFRCDSACRIAALGEPLVHIRKHGQNYSADNLKTTLSQIRILKYVIGDDKYKSFRDLMNRQIVIRSIAAFDAAFAAGDLDQCRLIAKDIPPQRRSPRLHIKAAVTAMPSPFGRWLQAALTAS
jgi:glycosyltransferase involved in cell wall biosynthesis